MQNATYTRETAKGPAPRGWWFRESDGVLEPIPYTDPGFDPMTQRIDLEQFWADLSSTERHTDKPIPLQR